MQTTMSEDERVKAGKEILRLHAENIWIIGTAGGVPSFNIVKNNLRNVSEESALAGAYGWTRFQRPDQFFWKK